MEVINGKSTCSIRNHYRNNEDVADIITDALEDLGVEVDEAEMTMADPADFEEADICVICPYTYDEGALPEEGIDFYEDLQEEQLAGKVYGVAGSGDTFYGDDFCVAVDKFGDALAKTGATKGAENVKINLAPDEEDIQKLDAFAKQLVEKAAKLND